MNIVCKPCFSIDTICALARNKYCHDDIPEIKKYIDKITHDLNIINSDWSLINALFQKMTWSIPEIEKMKLEDLKSVFPDSMNSIDYLLPSKKHIEIALDRLLKSDFTKLWNDLCLPLLKRQCTEVMDILSVVDTDVLLNDINLIRNEKIDSVIIYLSYFLEGGIGLCTGVNAMSYKPILNFNRINLIIHELLHGFINDEVTRLYEYICQNDELQKKTRWYLSNRWGSGGAEEEFVHAMEHYISVKNGIETLEESQNRLNNYYDKSMPLAVILFNELIKEKDVPKNYNVWLIEHLKGIIEYGNIQKQADEICSDYSLSFMNHLSEYKKSNCVE